MEFIDLTIFPIFLGAAGLIEQCFEDLVIVLPRSDSSILQDNVLQEAVYKSASNPWCYFLHSQDL